MATYDDSSCAKYTNGQTTTESVYISTNNFVSLATISNEHFFVQLAFFGCSRAPSLTNKQTRATFYTWKNINANKSDDEKKLLLHSKRRLLTCVDESSQQSAKLLVAADLAADFQAALQQEKFC